VRCAACRHSWFQEPAPLDLPLTRDEVPTAAPSPAPPPVQPPAVPASDLVARYAEGSPPAEADPFAHEPPFRPRRNPARMWTLLALLFALLAVVALGALVVFGPSDLGERLGLRPREVPLTIQVTRKPERRPTLSGSELLAVTGRIINPTETVQTVPDIRAELRDGQGRTVYSWTITRPARTLQPGAMAEFDSAAVDVPRGSKALNLSFASAAAD
jgi:hypothetical protein